SSVCYITIIFFFFSSRRRHTRSKRDWSSDVCSSDLATGGRKEKKLEYGDVIRIGDFVLLFITDDIGACEWKIQPLTGDIEELNRSEERRVGKECRERRRADIKKKT